MSMTNDIMGFGRSAYVESTGALEPEIADMRLADAKDLEEGTDLMEFMTSVAYECDLNMKDLEMAVIADEYNYLRENGEEMVYEDNRIRSFINKFKETTKKVWEKIQSFYKSALKKIDEFLKLDQRFIDKYGSDAKKGTAHISCYPFKSLYDDIEAMASIMHTLATESSTVASTFLTGKISTFSANDMKDTSKEEDDSSDSDDSSVKDELHTIAGKIGFTNVEEYDENNPSLAPYFKNMITVLKKQKAVRTVEGAKALDWFKRCKKNKELIKKTYEGSKKLINSHLKAAKTAETQAKKFKVLPTKTSSAYHKLVKVLSTLQKWCVMTNKYTVKMFNMYRSQCKAAVAAAAKVSKGDKGTTKDNTNSTQYNSMSMESVSFLDSFTPDFDSI